MFGRFALKAADDAIGGGRGERECVIGALYGEGIADGGKGGRLFREHGEKVRQIDGVLADAEAEIHLGQHDLELHGKLRLPARRKRFGKRDGERLAALRNFPFLRARDFAHVDGAEALALIVSGGKVRLGQGRAGRIFAESVGIERELHLFLRLFGKIHYFDGHLAV